MGTAPEEKKKRCDELKRLLKSGDLPQFVGALASNATGAFGSEDLFNRVASDVLIIGDYGGDLGVALANRALHGSFTVRGLAPGKNARSVPGNGIIELDPSARLYQSNFYGFESERPSYSTTVLAHELGHAFVGFSQSNDPGDLANSGLVENRVVRSLNENAGLDERIRKTYLGKEIPTGFSDSQKSRVEQFIKEWGCDF